MKCKAMLVSVVLLAACDSPQVEDSTALSVTVDSTGAVPVISVAGEAPVWTLDSLAAIRAEPTVGFSRVRSLALDPRGGIWVADVGENRLSYFADDGAWIEDRGRVGSGPGEFRTPYGIAVYAGGLLVHDVDNSRIVRFALDGGADTSWVIGTRLTGDAMSVRLYPNADGPLLLDVVRDTNPPRRVYARVGTDEQLIAPPRSAALVDSKECMNADAIHFFGSPFSPIQIASAYGRGSVATEGGDYRLDIFNGSAALKRTITRKVARDSISQAEFDAENADWLKYSAANNTAGCRGDIKRYEFKPAIRALLPDADGRLWVERRKQGGFVYEVWQGDSLIAQVPAPDREEGIPPVMLGDRLAVVAESPDEGHEVRLYRIRKSGQ
jgi:hypothetical protein